MGGTGGTRTETTPTAPQIPPELKPLVDKAVTGTTGAMDNIDINDFIGSFVQQIPNLTPDELQWMQKIFSWASDPNLTQGAEQGMDLTRSASEASPYEGQGADYGRSAAGMSGYETEGADLTRGAAGTDPFEQLAGTQFGAASNRASSGGQTSKGEMDAMDWLRAAMGKGHNFGSVGARDASATRAGVDTNTAQMKRAQEIAQQLTGGDVGQSPATQQAMKAWEQFVKPQVMAGQALTGNLGGGSTEEALGLSSTAALTPLMAKEIDTRQAMASMLGQLGLGASGQELAASQTNAQLGTEVSERNADRDMQAQVANLTARFQEAGLDDQTAMNLAQVAAGAKSRELASGATMGQIAQGLGQLGGQRKGRELAAGGQMAQIGGQQKGRELAAGSLLAQIGAGQQGRKLQAGGQLAAIGTEKANLTISALSKALETAGMPRDIATKQAEAQYRDFLRRQSLAEQMYLGPTGQALAGALTPGNIVTSRQTGGGLFGS